MKKICCVAVLACVLFSSTGCSWFVPSALKREASLVKVDVQTSLAEVEALAGDAAKEKALRTLRRIEPHVVNIDNYMQGRKASKE